MPLVFGAIAPHGGMVIPELAGDRPELAAETRAAMVELGRRLEALRPDTVVVLTPHGIRVEGTMAVSVSERAAGTQSAVFNPEAIHDRQGATISVDFDVDKELGHAIADRSAALDVPAARYIYGGSSGPACNIPLDWGAIVPLYFMGYHFARRPKIVVICPSRQLPREAMVRHGRAIAEVAEATDRRVALIASADHAHAHDPDSRYGHDPAAAEYDGQMVDAVKANDLKRLLTTDDGLIARAKPDSLWQMLILAGALDVAPLRGELLSYEVPSYFGMLCAAYQRASP